MMINFNISSLKVILKPLTEKIREARNLAEKNKSLYLNGEKTVGDVDDLFLKIKNSLLVVGLKGVVEFVSLNEKAFNLASTMDNASDVYQAVKDNLHYIEKYIEKLAKGESDNSVAFFYNRYTQLGELINLKLKNEDLFFPRLDIIKSGVLGGEIENELKVGRFFDRKDMLDGFKEDFNSTADSLKEDLYKIKTMVDSISADDEWDDFFSRCSGVIKNSKVIKNMFISSSIYVYTGLVCVFASIIGSANSLSKDIVQSKRYEIKEVIDTIVNEIDRMQKEINELNINQRLVGPKLGEENSKKLLLFIINKVRQIEGLENLEEYSDLSRYFDINFYKDQLDVNTYETVGSEVVVTDQDVDALIAMLSDHMSTFTSLTVVGNSFIGLIGQIVEKLGLLKDVTYNNRELLDVLDFMIKYTQSMPDAIQKNSEEDQTKAKEELERELSYAVIVVSLVLAELKEKGGKADIISLMDQIPLVKKRMESILKNNKVDSSLPLPRLDSISWDRMMVIAKKAAMGELCKFFEYIEDTIDEYIRYEDVSVGSLNESVVKLNKSSLVLLSLGEKKLSEILRRSADVWSKVIDGKLSGTDQEVGESIKWMSGVFEVVKAYISDLDNIQFIKNKVIDVYREYSDQYGEMPEDSKMIIKEEKVPQKKENKSHAVSGNNELAGFFLDEMLSLKEDISQGIQSLETGDVDRAVEVLTDLRRAFHTIKGSAKTVGFMDVGDVSLIAESFLDTKLSELVNSQGDVISPNELKAVSYIFDTLYGWYESAQGGDIKSLDSEQVNSYFKELLTSESKAEKVDVDYENNELDVLLRDDSQDLDADKPIQVANESEVAASDVVIMKNEDIKNHWNTLVIDMRSLLNDLSLGKLSTLVNVSMSIAKVSLFQNKHINLLTTDITDMINRLSNNTSALSSDDVMYDEVVDSLYQIDIENVVKADVERCSVAIHNFIKNLHLKSVSNNHAKIAYEAPKNEEIDLLIDKIRVLFDSHEKTMSSSDGGASSVTHDFEIDYDKIKDVLHGISNELKGEIDLLNQKLTDALHREQDATDNGAINEVSNSVNGILDFNEKIESKIDSIIEAQSSLRELYKSGVNRIRSELRSTVKKKSETSTKKESLLEKVKGLLKKK